MAAMMNHTFADSEGFRIFAVVADVAVALLLLGFTAALVYIEGSRQRARIEVVQAEFRQPTDTSVVFDVVNRGHHASGIEDAWVEFVESDGHSVDRRGGHKIEREGSQPYSFEANAIGSSLNVAPGERARFRVIFRGRPPNDAREITLHVKPVLGVVAGAHLLPRGNGIYSSSVPQDAVTKRV